MIYRLIKRSIEKAQQGLVYQIVLITIALIDAGALLYAFFGSPSDEIINVIFTFDIAVAYVFLTDFIVGILFADKKFPYFKTNWLNLLSGIPFNDSAFRILRLLRIVRAVRVMRATGALISIGQASVFFSRMRRK